MDHTSYSPRPCLIHTAFLFCYSFSGKQNNVHFIYLLIPGIYDYAVLYGKINFTGMGKVNVPRWGDGGGLSMGPSAAIRLLISEWGDRKYGAKDGVLWWQSRGQSGMIARKPANVSSSIKWKESWEGVSPRASGPLQTVLFIPEIIWDS